MTRARAVGRGRRRRGAGGRGGGGGEGRAKGRREKEKGRRKKPSLVTSPSFLCGCILVFTSVSKSPSLFPLLSPFLSPSLSLSVSLPSPFPTLPHLRCSLASLCLFSSLSLSSISIPLSRPLWLGFFFPRVFPLPFSFLCLTGWIFPLLALDHYHGLSLSLASLLPPSSSVYLFACVTLEFLALPLDPFSLCSASLFSPSPSLSLSSLPLSSSLALSLSLALSSSCCPVPLFLFFSLFFVFGCFSLALGLLLFFSNVVFPPLPHTIARVKGGRMGFVTWEERKGGGGERSRREGASRDGRGFF